MTSQSVIPSYRSLKDSGLTLTTIFTSLISEHRSCSKLNEPSPFSLRQSKDPLKSARQSDNQKRAKDIKSIPELRILETQISRMKTNTEEKTMNSKDHNSLDTLFNDVGKEDVFCPLIPEDRPDKKARKNTKSKNSIYIDDNRKSQSIKKLARLANPRKPIPSKHISLKKLSDSIMTGRPPVFVHLRTSKDKSQSSNPMKSMALSNVSIHKPEVSNQIKSFDQRIHFFSHRPANLNEAGKKSEKSRDIHRLGNSIKNISGLNVSLKACIKNLYKDRTASKKNAPKGQSKSFKTKRFSLIQFPKVMPNVSALNKHTEGSENVNKTNIRVSKDKDAKNPGLNKEQGFLGALNKSSLENHSSVFRVLQRMNAINKTENKPTESRQKKIALQKPFNKLIGLSLKAKPLTPRNLLESKAGPTFNNYFKVGNYKKAPSKKVNPIEIFESEVVRDATPKSITEYIKLSKLRRNDFKELDELKNESSMIFELTRKASTNRNSVERSLLESKEEKIELNIKDQAPPSALDIKDQEPPSAQKGSFKFIPISLESLTQLPQEPSSKQLTSTKPLGRNSSKKNLNREPSSIRDLGTIDFANIKQPSSIIKTLATDLKLITSHLEKESFLRHYNNADFTMEMKSTVVDWLFQLTAELQISRQTLYIGLHILQRYLAKTKLNPETLQFDALTALTLAIKFEEVHYLSMEQLVKSMEDTYSIQQLVENERKMYATLDYYIQNYTILCLLHTVQLYWDSSEDSELLSRLPKDMKYPKFLEKTEESYNLYRISMNQLDYLMMTHEDFGSFEQMIASILIASLKIFYQSVILKDASLNKLVIDVAVCFVEQLFNQKHQRTTIISEGLLLRLKHLPNVLEIPASETYSTYHEYLFTQVHNPALLEYIDSLLD